MASCRNFSCIFIWPCAIFAWCLYDFAQNLYCSQWLCRILIIICSYVYIHLRIVCMAPNDSRGSPTIYPCKLASLCVTFLYTFIWPCAIFASLEMVLGILEQYGYKICFVPARPPPKLLSNFCSPHRYMWKRIKAKIDAAWKKLIGMNAF